MGSTISSVFSFAKAETGKPAPLKTIEEGVSLDRIEIKAESHYNIITKQNTAMFRYFKLIETRNNCAGEIITKAYPITQGESDSDSSGESESSEEEEEYEYTPLEEIKVSDKEPDQEKTNIESMPINSKVRSRKRNQETTKEELSKEETENNNTEFPFTHYTPNESDDLYRIEVSKSLMASYFLMKDIITTETLLLSKYAFMHTNNNEKKDVLLYTDVKKDYEKMKLYGTKLNMLVDISSKFAQQASELPGMPDAFVNVCKQIAALAKEIDCDELQRFTSFEKAITKAQQID
jgi:hypothetical protein